MATAYYPGCDTEDMPFYVCDPCEDFEGSRIRSVALIAATYFSILNATPTNPVLWRNGILNGDVIIIPKVTGTLDAPEPTTGPGYGDDEESNLGTNYTLAWRDPNYKNNCNFYNTMSTKNGVYYVAFRTATQTHLSTKTVTLNSRAPVTENVEDNMEWNGTAKWRSKLSPCPFDTPVGIFTCFDLLD